MNARRSKSSLRGVAAAVLAVAALLLGGLPVRGLKQD